jgi:rubrerythrin
MAAGGGFLLRRQRELSPETVADRILVLAKADDDAELTVAEVVAGLKLPEAAVQEALELLQKRGRCRREYHDDHVVYVFPGLKESKLIRKCAYCGTTYSVKEPLHTCPNCGGTVELVREGS